MATRSIHTVYYPAPLCRLVDALSLSPSHPVLSCCPKVAKPKKKKAKMGMMESFRFLLTNKYLGCMCVLVVAYGLSINFTEVRDRHTEIEKARDIGRLIC